MSYSINYSDLSKVPLIIEDGTINATTDLALLGRSVGGYGQYIAQNFLHLVENFASPTPPEAPTHGQMWYDSQNDLLKYYNTSSQWKNVNSSNVNAFGPPEITGDTTLNYASAEGDIWYDTTKDYLYIYAEGQWLNILQFDQNNRFFMGNRYDNVGTLHKTMEFIVNGKVVYILSTDDQEWIPSSYGTTAERLPDGRLMVSDYPLVKKGINLNYDRSYNLHYYYVTMLNELTVDVGLGDVYLEQNQFDGNGPGFTFRPSSDPDDQSSFFSLRSFANDSKLWVGSESTTVAKNNFAVGFTGDNGEEHDLTKYNFVVDTDGNINASSIQLSGNAVVLGDVSAATASGDWIATVDDVTEGTSLEKIITPATLRQGIAPVTYFGENTKIVKTERKSKAGGTYEILEHIVNDEIVKITYAYDTYTLIEFNDSELDYQGRQLNTMFNTIIPGDNFPSSVLSIINPTSAEDLTASLQVGRKALPADHDPEQPRLYNLNYILSDTMTDVYYDPANPDENVVYTGGQRVSKSLSFGSRYSTTVTADVYSAGDPEHVQEEGVWKDVVTIPIRVRYREWIPLYNFEINVFSNFINANSFSVRAVQEEIPNVEVVKEFFTKTWDIANISNYSSTDFIYKFVYAPSIYAFLDPLYESNGNYTDVSIKIQTQIPTGTFGAGTEIKVFEAYGTAELGYMAYSDYQIRGTANDYDVERLKNIDA